MYPRIQNIFSKDYFNFIVIAISACIIYANSFNCSFQFDDFADIVENAAIHDIGNINAWITYVPSRAVGMFTFALNYHIHRLNVWGYHFVNLIIHILNGFIIYGFVKLTLSTNVFQKSKLQWNSKIFAVCTALLFISHPIQTQAVTYIVQRLASLATLFYLLSLFLYAKARLFQGDRRKQIILFSTSFLAAITGMFTKEIVFTLPFAIILYEVCFLKNYSVRSVVKNKKVIGIALLFILLLLIIPLIFLNNGGFQSIFKDQTPVQGHKYTLSVSTYLLTEFRVITTYIRLLFLPINQNLDYDYPVSTTFFHFPTLLSFIFLAAIIVSGILIFKKYRLISFGVFFFFLTLTVESSIIPIQNVIFEHRIYLPSFGFFIAVTAFLYHVFSQKNQKILFLLIILIICINSYLTFHRNIIWKTELSLWNDVVKKSPHKARPWNNRGKLLLDKGEYENALNDFNNALKMNPHYAQALNNRGAVYFELKQFDKSLADINRALELQPIFLSGFYNRSKVYTELCEYDNALQDLDKVLKIEPKYIRAINNKGIIFQKRKQYEQAIDLYSEAVKLEPRYYDAFFNRGTVLHEIGQNEQAINDFCKTLEIFHDHQKALFNRGRSYREARNYQAAISDFNRLLQLNPNFSEVFFERGLTFMESNIWEKALEDFNKVLTANKNHVEALYNRGSIYLKLKKFEKAQADFDEAIQIDPSNAITFKNRGFYFVMIQNFDKAISDFTKAIELDSSYVEAYNNRGNVYTKLKEYKKAIADYSKALALNSGYANALYNRSLCYFYSNDFQKAYNDVITCQKLGVQVNQNYLNDLQKVLNN